jgi:hypothetical protein
VTAACRFVVGPDTPLPVELLRAEQSGAGQFGELLDLPTVRSGSRWHWSSLVAAQVEGNRIGVPLAHP